jgi:hypothetical protein
MPCKRESSCMFRSFEAYLYFTAIPAYRNSIAYRYVPALQMNARCLAQDTCSNAGTTLITQDADQNSCLLFFASKMPSWA